MGKAAFTIVGASTAALVVVLIILRRRRQKVTLPGVVVPPLPCDEEPGRALLERSSTVPSVLPLAFVISTVVRSAEDVPGCAGFARAIRALESLLVLASGLDDAPELVQRLLRALEGVLPLLRTEEAAVRAEQLRAKCEQLEACACELSLPHGSHPPSLFRHPARLLTVQAEAAAELQRRQIGQPSAATMQLLKEQNRLLVSRVSELRIVLERQQMEVEAFMRRFPLPAAEPERRIKLHGAGLAELMPPYATMEAELDRLVGSGALGPELCGLFVTLVLDERQRFLAIRLKKRKGEGAAAGHFLTTVECGAHLWPTRKCFSMTLTACACACACACVASMADS